LTEKIDKILTLLQDGEWHPIREITQKTKLNQTKIQLITNFLTRYNLIKLNKAQQEAKLTPPTHKFIKKIQEDQ
jgi:DNA-binding IclR family transcriptional regulator